MMNEKGREQFYREDALELCLWPQSRAQTPVECAEW